MRKVMLPILLNIKGFINSTIYSELVLDTFGSSIIGYWPLWEPRGTVAQDISGNNRNGVYSSTGIQKALSGIGDNGRSVKFDGTNGQVNIYSTGLASAFNAEEGTIVAWANANSSGAIVSLYHNGNNLICIGHGYWHYFAGSGANNLTYADSNRSGSDFVPYAITWSKSNDRVRAYYKGVQIAPDMTGMGVWVPPIYNNQCWIGDGYRGKTDDNVAHVFILNREATADEILAISNPNAVAPWSTTSWIIPQYATNIPAIMIQFDDEYESVYTEGYLRMSAKDMKGTFYVMTDAIDGTNDPPYITHDELQTMDAAGWSIGNHTTDQTLLATVDQATAETKISGAITALEALGLTRASHHLAYPGGSWNNTTVEAAMIACNMLTGRRVYTSPIAYPDYDPSNNLHIWSTDNLRGGYTVTQALNAIDAAISLKKTILFYGHKLVSPADDTTKWEPWKLTQLINYIGLKNIPSLTINDYYDLQSGPKTITRNPA